MSDCKVKRALISVYDKTGVVEFARALVEEFGVEIISTGGTAALLTKEGIPVTLVEEVTGFPEMMDGRVKTLHPKIHAGILADRDNPKHMRQLEAQGIKPIDMVVVNLYPFEKTIADPNCTFEQAIEMIDIGGPCMLRAAAKNHRHVVVVDQTHQYETAIRSLRQGKPEDLDDLKDSGAFGAFNRTCMYDAAVSSWLGRQGKNDGSDFVRHMHFLNWGGLRYGENPHQNAELLRFWEPSAGIDLTTADVVEDEPAQSSLSFNNYVDADAALGLCAEVSRELCGTQAAVTHSCVFIKHTNACGVGLGSDPVEAYRQAYLGDPNAAMGGILACDFDVTADFAEAAMDTYARWGKTAGAGGFFIEVWVAPAFDDEAIKVIRTKKKWGERVRLLAVGDMGVAPDPDELDYKKISGGMLLQSRDLLGLNEDQWKVVTKRQPTDPEMADLRLAWLVCKHTKSNAITICIGGSLVGNGAGQMSRVMSCRIATWLAKENGHEGQLAGSVAASDAFFPFPDGPGILIDAGVKAIIQPGGSKRDRDTIAACDERDVAMIHTGTRHFKH